MLNFDVHVAVRDLDRVGPYGFFGPLTRLSARLAGMNIVQRVEHAPIPTVIGRVPCYKIHVERKATADQFDVFHAHREVEAEIDKFIDQMAKA